MPKPIKQSKIPTDVNQLAHYLVQESTRVGETTPGMQQLTEAQVSAYMSEMGRKGGKIGGKRRLVTMTARKRSAIAKKAAEARWHKGAANT
jgi:hypothetical protein